MKLKIVGEISNKIFEENLKKYNLFDKCELFFGYGGNFDVDIIITRGINFVYDQNYLSKFKNLKNIIVLQNGIDNVDKQYCEQNGIELINFPQFSVYYVAEYALNMLILALRNSFEIAKNLVAGNYTREPIGNGLSGIKIGIMGYGRIGKMFVELLSFFAKYNDFEILVYDIYPQANDNNPNIKFFENYDSFLSNIDYLCVLINKIEKKAILNEEFFSKSKNLKGIVNVSRPGVVDENIILEKLDKNILNFYCTDVLQGEPNIDKINKDLVNHKKVFASSHIGANIEKIQEHMIIEVVKNIHKHI